MFFISLNKFIKNGQGAGQPKTMKIMSWSVHRLGSPLALRRLQQMLKLHNLHIVFFIETKLDSIKMERVRRKGGFVHDIDESTEGIMGDLTWDGSLISM